MSTQLENHLVELDRYDKQFIRIATSETNPADSFSKLISLSYEAFEVYIKILLEMSEHSYLDFTNNDARVIANKINKNEPIEAINFYIEIKKKIKDVLGVDENDPISEWLMEDYDKIQDSFFVSFDIKNYYRDKIKIACIVHDLSVVKNYTFYFKEIRECFAYNQYLAAIALCRSLVELSIKHIFTKRGIHFSDTAPLGPLIQLIKPAHELKLLIECLTDVNEACKKFIHIKSPRLPVSESECLDTIKKTLYSIELLIQNQRKLK